MQHINNLRQIFLRSVESVRPANLLSEANNYFLQPRPMDTSDGLYIRMQGRTMDIIGRRCHVVGFGKAVLGMAVQLERALGPHLAGGVLSVPSGTLSMFEGVPEMQLQKQTRITIFEGAANNQPDENAFRAAVQIKQLAASMTKHDILFVLISGGGSALLPLPRHPLSLTQKMQIVRQLANRGASIDELNIVRIALSDIKGGRLAAAARHAHAVISFVISDIVGDPIDLIASGPTCAAVAKRSTPEKILAKYEMWQELPMLVQHLLQTPAADAEMKPGDNNSIYVIGDNRVATATAVQEALQCGYNPFIASTVLEGEVSQLVGIYMEFLRSIGRLRGKQVDEEELRRRFPFDSRIFQHFIKTLRVCEKTDMPLLLIMAGEPTVKITGQGLGGRNQEIALRMSLELHEDPGCKHISFLSAGTDGIDGPTPAAGAIGNSLVIEEFQTHCGGSVADVRAYLANNDSYSFYKGLSANEFHIVTGHTGTNVMDLQLILLA